MISLRFRSLKDGSTLNYTRIIGLTQKFSTSSILQQKRPKHLQFTSPISDNKNPLNEIKRAMQKIQNEDESGASLKNKKVQSLKVSQYEKDEGKSFRSEEVKKLQFTSAISDNKNPLNEIIRAMQRIQKEHESGVSLKNKKIQSLKVFQYEKNKGKNSGSKEVKKLQFTSPIGDNKNSLHKLKRATQEIPKKHKSSALLKNKKVRSLKVSWYEKDKGKKSGSEEVEKLQFTSSIGDNKNSLNEIKKAMQRIQKKDKSSASLKNKKVRSLKVPLYEKDKEKYSESEEVKKLQFISSIGDNKDSLNEIKRAMQKIQNEDELSDSLKNKKVQSLKVSRYEKDKEKYSESEEVKQFISSIGDNKDSLNEIKRAMQKIQNEDELSDSLRNKKVQSLKVSRYEKDKEKYSESEEVKQLQFISSIGDNKDSLNEIKRAMQKIQNEDELSDSLKNKKVQSLKVSRYEKDKEKYSESEEVKQWQISTFMNHQQREMRDIEISMQKIVNEASGHERNKRNADKNLQKWKKESSSIEEIGQEIGIEEEQMLMKVQKAARRARYNVPGTELDLNKVLALFKQSKSDWKKTHYSSRVSETPSMDTWNALDRYYLQLSIVQYPSSPIEEIMQWTEQGKLWKFPIDNEQDMEEERNVHFSQHVFLDQHLAGWCPTIGPIRQFMDLVCIGLSKNPYLTVEEKKSYIMYYKNYFLEKTPLLKSLGIWNTPQALQGAKKQSIEAN